MSCSNIIGALQSLKQETTLLELSSACQHVGESLAAKSIGLQEAIQILSEHILNFENAKLFRKYLSNVLLAIVSSKIQLKPVFSKAEFQTCCDLEKIKHLEYSIVLSLLSEHPDIKQYTLKYFEINPVPPFEVYIHHEEGYNVAPKKRRVKESQPNITVKDIVTCCYKLLQRLPNELSIKWDWSNFVTGFSKHDDPEIRWMVKECMVILTNMTEAQSKVLSKNLKVTGEGLHQSLLAQDKNIVLHTDLPVGESNFIEASVVTINGILLSVYDKSNVQSDNLVPVKSTINNLRSLALAVASGQALCLMGPVGSGKTCLVEHLAAITGRKGIAFKKVQLGDQTDSRMLLGSQQCTDIPGEFVWRPGVLTEAVQNGHWLLLEDIDCAALDVASTLSSLLERNALCVPGYRDSLPVTPGFQLFVTQRTLTTNFGYQKRTSTSSNLLQKHLTQINVEPLSRTELAEIIQTLYPTLKTISPRMIEVFMMFSVGSHDTSLQATENSSNKDTSLVTIIRGSRLISTRDLMKWCSRAVIGFDVTSVDSALKVLQDALDIFTCSVSSPENRLELAKKVGTCLGIVENKSEFYCKHYKPNVALLPSVLEVGRAKVLRKEKSLESMDFDAKRVVFSFTRQSACLLERIACCVMSNEPVLLVGETGTGKTSSIQYLARQTGHKLVVINMNQQSDSADLLGGYKPVDLKYIIKPIKNEFEELFRSFYNVEKNKKFLCHISTCYETENWTALLALMNQSYKSAITRLRNERNEKIKKWLTFGNKLVKLEQQVKAASRLTFAFIEGSLVKAMQEGYWVLLDEINLASAEILECLAGLLEDKNENVELLEKGDKAPIQRHPDFTLFACMNPATDVGKKDLPVGLRNRFTEFFIDELTERNDLMLLIGDYLYHMNLNGAILEEIYNFYSNVKKEAKLNLVDGSGNAPHYSLRTLCRALTAAAKAKCGTVARSLYESFCLSFLTQLDSSSHPKVEAMIARAVIGKKNLKSVLNQLIPEPQVKGQNFLLFEGHWIPQGKLGISIPEGYILTQTVRKNLRDIARIISLGRLPVLLQGDTSVGKTSLITYIAKASGNYCVRINNHEHTDLQEYIGSYSSDANGKLVFKEGVLVEAMRKGYWIILDELNLAPSDVLEALNRVLDDNRELFIPETQQVVKADPNFMLFATQNPPGLYGGRKMLSRAFRNRFVELHFDEIPKKELETILHQRCHIPPTYSKKMIAVMAELQIRRRGSAAVQGKDGFITLRDLFRWGQRYKLASKDILTDEKFYDWDQHIADEGYLVLAGKVRQTEERFIIEEVIEKHIKRKVNPDNLFTLHATTSPVTKPVLELLMNNRLEEFSHVVWTFNMRRLAVLIAKSFSFNEPVLLVGETGCGKTTVCQVLATLKKSQLLSVNCHMHTESSDFLGGLRPVRHYNNDGRLFEWVDGPLIKAMESGHMFLADEISLADDSVLERLNSLLESERQLVLAERGMEDNADILAITAAENFHFIGTMNPGGDFGKKELSPALRNRFTEIWCDSVTTREDLLAVLEKSVMKGISLGNQEDGTTGIGNSILDFTEWLKNSEVTNKFPFSIRDILSWVNFINVTTAKGLLDTPESYVHGACMTFLDCFGTALTGHIESETLRTLRKNAVNFLLNQIKTVGNEYTDNLRELLSYRKSNFVAESNDVKFGIHPFFIETGPRVSTKDEDIKFTFTAPTTGSNTLRLLRGLQLNKAILLEGNPGVGKTSLVTALAKASGHKVVRINLSDQTDITDLFGTDLPTEDGSFTFKEGAFLSALQNGDWILLDELNLAPQPVLEGLNACLDHRGEVYIPELGQTFKVKDKTRLFACQNPLKQGGARRGLPLSFLNRFTQVYIDTLTEEDLKFIVESQFPSLPKDVLHKIVKFNCKIAHEIVVLQSWAHRGSPWEMNLRDIQRWCEALTMDQEKGVEVCPGKFVEMLYINRMRTLEDKKKMTESYNQVFGPKYPRSDSTPQFSISDKEVIVGDVSIERSNEKVLRNRRALDSSLLILRNQLPTLKALVQSVKMNWLTILVGPTATGKSSIVQVLADLAGHDLQIVPVTSAMDVSDLLGGFEQVDYNRNLENIYEKIEKITIATVRQLWLTQNVDTYRTNKLLNHLYQYRSLQTNFNNNSYSNDEVIKFNEKLDLLLKHCEKLFEHNDDTENLNESLKELVSKLKTLKTKVAKVSSVNAGGKFEWVDSVLVKTMTEGSWLLLDNVNLTSAAVLDRLNALLEPNGVLSIPERGEISELRPHKNFRVFFTIDPKYGDISRAMRNRGVEIFLLRPEELDVNLLDTTPYMDIDALLSSCGLPKLYHEISIACHESMAAFVRGIERPTISHLLQAAHLTWQQVVRGISYKTALLNSFSDVYIKPRCGGDFASEVNVSLAEMKNNMLKELQKVIEDRKLDVLDSIEPTHTLTVQGLSLNSALEVAKQDTYLLLHQLLESSEKCSIHTLSSVFVSYTRCPNESLGVFNKIIKEITKGRNVSTANQLQDTAHLKLREHSTDLHKRFFPEKYKLDLNKVKEFNTLTILLYSELWKKYSEIHVPDANFSALDYSKAVLNGDLTDDFVEYPILKNTYNYIQIVDELIEHAVKQSKEMMTDENSCKLMQLLIWRKRFVQICSVPIFVRSKNKRTPILKEEIVPLLYTHCKWLQKHLLGELSRTLPQNSHLKSKFDAAMNNMDVNSDQEFTKISKKLRKKYGQPKLYANDEQYQLSVQRTTLINELTLDLNNPIERQMEKLNAIVVSDIELALDVPEEQSVSKLREIKEKITESKSVTELEHKLIPVNIYVMQRVLNLLQNYLQLLVTRDSSKLNVYQSKIQSQELLKQLVDLGRITKGFPQKFLILLRVVQQIGCLPKDLEQSLSSLTVEFWDEFYNVLTESPSHYPLVFFDLHKEVSLEVNLELPINTRRVTANMPLLSYYVQKLTISGEDAGSRHKLAYERVSLEDRDAYTQQLSSLLNIVWKNMATLDAAVAFKLNSDAVFEMNKFEQFICCLYSIFKLECSDDFSYELVQETIALLKVNIQSQDTTFVEMMEEAHKVYETLKLLLSINIPKHERLKTKVYIANLSLLTSFMFGQIMAGIKSVDHVEKYRLKVQYIEEDINIFDTMLSSYYLCGLVTGTITSKDKIEKSCDVTPQCYHEGSSNREDLKRVHPYCSILLELKQKTADGVHKYASGNTFRPTNVPYQSFFKDCKHFTNSVLSSKTVRDISRNLITTTNVLQETIQKGEVNTIVIKTAKTVIKETTTWLYSLKAFYKKIQTIYSDAFPDLAKPLQSSLSQVAYSVTLLKDLIKELIAKIEQGPVLTSSVTDLMEFPNRISTTEGIEAYLNRFVSEDFLQLLNRNILAVNVEDKAGVEQEFIEVLKMNLTELKMYCYAMESVSPSSFAAVMTTLDQVVKTWETQQRDIERKKQDDEALYVTKSKCEDEDDEAVAVEEIIEMFPSHLDNDFAEFKPIGGLEQRKVDAKIPENKTRHFISNEDVTLIYNWHSNFVRNMTKAEWLTQSKKVTGFDPMSALMERYPIFSRVIQNGWDALGAELEGVVTPSLMVFISQIKAKIEGDESQKDKADFYRSGWVSETRQCLPLLKRVKDSTNDLLDQWPDFPTLKDIMVIVNRILSFPVTSPVSRFLTGLELLRDKIEEWNKHAHKGNNLIDISLEVGQQIINWRKLEMSHWKECLNSLYQRKQAEAHKYWFFLYSVINLYLTETSEDGTEVKEPVPPERVISVLKDFMEKSNLAEYEVRLDIIYSYHCHLVHLPQSTRRDELISILWNVYNYYAQFTAAVATYTKDKRAPIEKKLKDFVKICTWDRDLSYWSVKDTVEKAHKVLHKHTKEFEKVLKESVACCLVDKSCEVSDHVGIWDRPKRLSGVAPSRGAYMTDYKDYAVLARNVKKYLDQAEAPSPILPEGSLLNKVPSLLNKAKALCKDAIVNSSYPSLVQALDDFVTTVIESNTHLGSLEVESTASKEKQKSQAKNILQQKRKALSDLFRYLSKMGLNYRTGLVMLTAANDDLYDFKIAPVDLDAAMSYWKSRRCDATLSLLWSGCETYFQKNIARHRLMTSSLLAPHQDLGMQNIERCKGFSAQLLKITNTQKKSISKYSRYLSELRLLTSNLTSALEIETDSNIMTINQKIETLTECYGNTSIVLEQFVVLLKSCPENELSPEYEPNFDVVLSDSPIVRCYKHSEDWKRLHAKVKSMISTVTKQKSALHKLRNTTPKVIGPSVNLLVLSQNHIDVTNESKATLLSLIDIVNGILTEYQFVLKSSEYVHQHPILRSVVNLLDYFKDTVTKLNELDRLANVSMEDNVVDQQNELVHQTEDVVASMLLIIQSVYKRHLPENKSSDNYDVLSAIDELIDEGKADSKESSESKEILEDNHLKELLQDNLSADTRMLQLEVLNAKIAKLLVNYVEFIATSNDTEKVKNAVTRVIPLLEQVVLFVQYFITQKVAVHRVSSKMLSVLLKIFSELTTKGFCKPSDLDLEDGEGEEGQGKLSGGTGLGDGEGQKDVSDRIENQDQLDDAHRPGEEKKNEDKDCKEEEKGVNMTDDFDSHLQDLDKKEGDDSEQEDDENDADKQMGDIDNAAEKLDQQIWGSEDEEEEEDENQKKDQEDKGTGESTGEKEMAAKEQEKGTDDDAKGKDRKEKKDINEMDEPEVDDDHVDPYHGNHAPEPEPEDFELPDNMDIDGDEDDKEGETESENPFEVNKMPDEVVEEENEKADEQTDGKDDGLQVSSDEEDGGEEEKEGGEKETAEPKDDETKPEGEENSDENEDGAADETEPEGNPETAEDQSENLEDNDIDAPRNPDAIDEEEKVDEQKQQPNPEATPSNNDPTAEDKVENAETKHGTDDNVETNPEQFEDEDDKDNAFEQAQKQGEEKQSTGRSQLDKSDKGHQGQKQTAKHAAEDKKTKDKNKLNKPGTTEQERTLGEVNDKTKKTQTLNVEQDEEAEDEAGDGPEQPEHADALQHVKQANKEDLQVIDSATKEQADEQPTLRQNEDEEAEDMKEDDEVAMDVDEEDIQVEKADKEMSSEKVGDKSELDKEKAGDKKDGGDDVTNDTGVTVEGDDVLTDTVPRGNENTYHTRLEALDQSAVPIQPPFPLHQSTSAPFSPLVPNSRWSQLWSATSGRARALCETLRLILEPTGRSRRAGDFRTGRAINMRRVIPYIASQFRKDRIWLRRTKPAKREYKIAIAVDDSSSMGDNRSKELAFESLALVSQALNLLESGDLAVLSFGEVPTLLHPFTEQFSEHSGTKILERLRFEQTKTKVAQLLDYCGSLFEEQSVRSDAINAKLLVIVSDGRGIFSEGEARVTQAVRRARQLGVFIVYVIIDNPENKDSIMDIRRPLFDPVTNSLSGFVTYLDTFPFPFYLILRDISALPTVLGDALRQWFELAANMAS